MSTRIRTLAYKAHTWIGLHAALYFCLIFLSGAVLEFAEELGQLPHPEFFVTQPAPERHASFGETYDAVKRAYPGVRVFVMQHSASPWLADQVFANRANGQRVVIWTDPATGEPLGMTGTRNLKGILRDFHDSLLAVKKPAYLAVSATSFFLFASILSGLITYRRFWKGFFRRPPRDGTARMRAGARHRLVAVWVAPFLLITSLTGMFYFFTGLGFEGSVPRSEPAAPRPAALPQGFDGATIDAAAAVARKALPDTRPGVVVLPRNAENGIQFGGSSGFLSHLAGGESVTVDPVTFNVLGIVHNSDRRGTARLRGLANNLHYGRWGGTFSRALWALFGFASAYLMVTAMRVYVARAIGETGAAPRTLSQYLRGLGLFRWAYAGLAAGVVAVAVARFLA